MNVQTKKKRKNNVPSSSSAKMNGWISITTDPLTFALACSPAAFSWRVSVITLKKVEES
jgi:hypothetical protein